MNLPREPADERRAVPRHIRDGEHDSWEDSASGTPPGPAARSRRVWSITVAVVVALAAACCAWFALR